MNNVKPRNAAKRVLFYRRLVKPNAGTNGGNLKLRDCFDHIMHSEQFSPNVFFSEDTRWFDHPGNHWNDLRETALEEWSVGPQDILFFSGHDWQSLSEAQRRRPPAPIINIVQPRHTRSQDSRRAFLAHPAIRIAKSEVGAEIIRQYGLNGPLYVIPDAIDVEQLAKYGSSKDIDILILGLKQAELARQVHQALTKLNRLKLRKLKIQLQLPPGLPTRDEFLQLLGRAKIVACLPLLASRGSEGFYLPALEAMAMDTLVVCPHAVGNIGHCIDHYNCIVPEYTLEAMVNGLKKALSMNRRQKEALLKNGRITARKHDIVQERTAILDLVHRAHEIWHSYHFT